MACTGTGFWGMKVHGESLHVKFSRIPTCLSLPDIPKSPSSSFFHSQTMALNKAGLFRNSMLVLATSLTFHLYNSWKLSAWVSAAQWQGTRALLRVRSVPSQTPVCQNLHNEVPSICTINGRSIYSSSELYGVSILVLSHSCQGSTEVHVWTSSSNLWVILSLQNQLGVLSVSQTRFFHLQPFCCLH